MTALAMLCLFIYAVKADLVTVANINNIPAPVTTVSPTTKGPDPLANTPADGGVFTASTKLTLQCKYYNEKDFMNSVLEAAKDRPPEPGYGDGADQGGPEKAAEASQAIAGGIVPHHLLAGKMIAAFFQALAEDAPETVVVIAPNHRRTGLNGLHTSTADWGTAFGTLEADPALTDRLITELNAAQNTALMEEEHSISALVPYIKYYLPEAKIVPVLLHGNYSPEASGKLGKLLADAMTDDSRAVMIASVDFSHYLDAKTADLMDEKTLEAILSNDISAISRMGNDHLDSPPSIVTLLSAMTELGAAAPEVTGHGNSSDITGNGFDYTTSYFTMLFRR